MTCGSDTVERSIVCYLSVSVAGRNSDEAARATRRRILLHVANVASEEGLDGLSIGRLATDLSLSKAGVVGPFGSKEDLQLATLDLAVQIFIDSVWTPAKASPPGLLRLEAVCDSWSAYLADPPLRGGCFVSAVAFEWDSRTGRVHDAVRQAARAWTDILEAEVRTAISAGELPADTDPEQVAFTLEALAAAATPARQLHGNDDAAKLCRRAMRSTLNLASASRRRRAATRPRR